MIRPGSVYLIMCRASAGPDPGDPSKSWALNHAFSRLRRTTSTCRACCSPASTKSPCTCSSPRGAPRTRAPPSSRRPAPPSAARRTNTSPVPGRQVSGWRTAACCQGVVPFHALNWVSVKLSNIYIQTYRYITKTSALTSVKLSQRCRKRRKSGHFSKQNCPNSRSKQMDVVKRK